jgi:hypothetical protein
MSPAKLPRMALSEHPRYSGLDTPARCVGIPRLQTGLQQPRMIRIRAFLKREWQQFRGICRYLRLRREAESLMRSYTAVAEAMGRPVMASPGTPEQQQRLDRVHQIRAEMIAIRWAFKN